MLEPASTALALALDELTEIQRRAVMHDEGPLLVLAGPGSGKTRVLTCRIGRILDSNREESFRVLGLTFTNKAADEMRDRVERLVPGFSRRLFLGTFHSFCADVLKQHGTHVGIRPDFRIYSSPEDLSVVMTEAVQKARERDSNVEEGDNAALPVIQRLKADLVRPEHAADHVVAAELKERIGSLYLAFEGTLRLHNALDFNSLVYYACELFQKYPAFAKRYRTVYPYWCVDEFQDTNASQYALLKAMAGKEFRNLFVVADDDQIIYQWNGASPRRLEELKRDFTPDIIQIPTNYRCPPEIVDLANNLIQHNLQRQTDRQQLRAAKPRGQNAVRVQRYTTDAEETAGIATEIATIHPDHLEEVVVLARTRRLLEAVKVQLEVEGVQALIAQRRDSFSSTPFIWMHACLKQSNARRDYRNIETIAGSFAVLTGVEVDVPSLIANANAKHGDYLREWSETVQATAPGSSAKRAAEEIMRHLVRGADFKAFVGFALQWLEELSAQEDQGAERFAGYRDDSEAWDDLYRETLSSRGESVSLESFLHELELRSKEPPLGSSRLALMTIHSAKGKEFDHVYLMGMAEDLIPSFQSKKKGDRSPEMEEERRNCFVAITRAKKSLTLTYAEIYFGWRKTPSRFIKEMGLQP